MAKRKKKRTRTFFIDPANVEIEVDPWDHYELLAGQFDLIFTSSGKKVKIRMRDYFVSHLAEALWEVPKEREKSLSQMKNRLKGE